METLKQCCHGCDHLLVTSNAWEHGAAARRKTSLESFERCSEAVREGWQGWSDAREAVKRQAYLVFNVTRVAERNEMSRSRTLAYTDIVVNSR
jgi:hypothetical protein